MCWWVGCPVVLVLTPLFCSTCLAQNSQLSNSYDSNTLSNSSSCLFGSVGKNAWRNSNRGVDNKKYFLLRMYRGKDHFIII